MAFELVSKYHPDKIADRIAGALVDYAYTVEADPKIAVEVLLGHGECKVIIETSALLESEQIRAIIHRIAGEAIDVNCLVVPQDEHLAENQETLHTGDNGIFRGIPLSTEQQELIDIRADLESNFPTDGKFILDIKSNKLIVCQSNATEAAIKKVLKKYNRELIINPLGEWTGGTNVDCGATNRKLGSDMGDSVTGGGIHGKDLSKGDVSINIYCFLRAQTERRIIGAYCAIGDSDVVVDGTPIPYKHIVNTANDYIKSIGGFEKLAEYGFLRK